MAKRKKKQVIEYFEEDCDETFAFIAGYTSGGAPYGITWDEWEEIEGKEQMDAKKQINDVDLPF